MVLKLALIFNYLFKVAKTSASRVFALNDCVKGIGTTTASTETADEVELVVSGDPGSDTVIVLKFIGVSSSSDAS